MSDEESKRELRKKLETIKESESTDSKGVADKFQQIKETTK